jgi:hypothetical protein
VLPYCLFCSPSHSSHACLFSGALPSESPLFVQKNAFQACKYSTTTRADPLRASSGLTACNSARGSVALWLALVRMLVVHFGCSWQVICAGKFSRAHMYHGTSTYGCAAYGAHLCVCVRTFTCMCALARGRAHLYLCVRTHLPNYWHQMLSGPDLARVFYHTCRWHARGRSHVGGWNCGWSSAAATAADD